VDAAEPKGELRPIWRFFGADEPNYAYMKHGQKLLAELGELGRTQVYFRAHNLLTSGDGTPALKWGSTGAYSEDATGRPVYNWTILDRIFDTYRERGVRPYVQIGFMPKDLSSKPEPYQHQWTPWLKRVVPLTLGLGATTFMFTFDMIAVQRFLENTGLYGAAGMIGRALMFLVAPMTAVMFPKIVQAAAKAERTDVLAQALGATALLAGGAAVFCTFFAEVPLRIVQGSKYLAAVPTAWRIARHCRRTRG
jgi:hypothetical protein